MMRSLIRTAVVVAIVALSGCADTPHRCPLKKGPGCESVTQIYQDAREVNPNLGGQWLPKDGAVGARSAGPNWATPARYAEPGNVGEPVFREPRVYRVWLAPFVDSQGNMHSGQYVYFSTPGEWLYGGLERTGQASPGLFQPLPAGKGLLGQSGGPTALKVPTWKPPKPAAARKDVTVNGITQPKETLTP
ncbi:MAG: TraV family lipoprotein [Steroidobacteraceae bacterium]